MNSLCVSQELNQYINQLMTAVIKAAWQLWALSGKNMTKKSLKEEYLLEHQH